MENNREVLKTGLKRRRFGISSVNLSFFIFLVSILALNCGILSADAVKRDGPRFSEFPEKTDWESIYVETDLDSEAVDPEAQPSIADVLTLLKTIQIELTTLRNTTTEENEEVKSQNEEIKNKLADMSIDLKGEMTSLSKQQKEIQSAVQSWNSSSLAVLTDPQFYLSQQFKGSPYTPSSDEWKTKCVDLPLSNSLISSLKTAGHCLLLCPETNCQSLSFGSPFIFTITCQKISAETKEVGNLKDIGVAYEIKSFRQC